VQRCRSATHYVIGDEEPETWKRALTTVVPQPVPMAVGSFADPRRRLAESQLDGPLIHVPDVRVREEFTGR
jgi:hypothetical protein